MCTHKNHVGKFTSIEQANYHNIQYSRQTSKIKSKLTPLNSNFGYLKVNCEVPLIFENTSVDCSLFLVLIFTFSVHHPALGLVSYIRYTLANI